jgi:hypothetical protein
MRVHSTSRVYGFLYLQLFSLVDVDFGVRSHLLRASLAGSDSVRSVPLRRSLSTPSATTAPTPRVLSNGQHMQLRRYVCSRQGMPRGTMPAPGTTLQLAAATLSDRS